MPLLLAAPLSFIIGVTLGLLGGGGSMLTVPMLIYVLGVAPVSAVSASLFVVGVTSATGAIAHAQAGRVRWRIGTIFGVAGMAGAYAGGQVAHRIPERVLLLAFGLLMLATSLVMMRGRHGPRPTPVSDRLPLFTSIALGAAVGVLAGLVGAGGGFFIVPALEIVGGLGLLEAIGTSPFITSMQSFAGFAGRLGHVELDWSLIGVVSALAVGGSLVGARIAHRLSPVTLRRTFAWLVLAVAVFFLAQQLPADRLWQSSRGARAHPRRRLRSSQYPLSAEARSAAGASSSVAP